MLLIIIIITTFNLVIFPSAVVSIDVCVCPGGKAHMSWKLKGLERCAKHTEARTYPRANAIYFYGQFA